MKRNNQLMIGQLLPAINTINARVRMFMRVCVCASMCFGKGMSTGQTKSETKHEFHARFRGCLRFPIHGCPTRCVMRHGQQPDVLSVSNHMMRHKTQEGREKKKTASETVHNGNASKSVCL